VYHRPDSYNVPTFTFVGKRIKICYDVDDYDDDDDDDDWFRLIKPVLEVKTTCIWNSFLPCEAAMLARSWGS